MPPLTGAYVHILSGTGGGGGRVLRTNENLREKHFRSPIQVDV